MIGEGADQPVIGRSLVIDGDIDRSGCFASRRACPCIAKLDVRIAILSAGTKQQEQWEQEASVHGSRRRACISGSQSTSKGPLISVLHRNPTPVSVTKASTNGHTGSAKRRSGG